MFPAKKKKKKRGITKHWVPGKILSVISKVCLDKNIKKCISI